MIEAIDAISDGVDFKQKTAETKPVVVSIVGSSELNNEIIRRTAISPLYTIGEMSNKLNLDNLVENNPKGAFVKDKRVILMPLSPYDIEQALETLSKYRGYTDNVVVICPDIPDIVHKFAEKGVNGVILYSSDISELQNAVRSVANKEVFLSDDANVNLSTTIKNNQINFSDSDRRPIDGLTGREQEVLKLVAKGYTNEQIAGELVISESTSKSHVSNILGKLRLPNRATAAAWHLKKSGQV